MTLEGADVDRIVSRLFVHWSHPRLSAAFRGENAKREPATCILRGRLRNATTPTAVARAIAEVIARVPRLRSRYQSGAWRPLAGDAEKIAASIFAERAIAPEEALSLSLSPTEGPAWRFFFSPPGDVLVAFHHALSDGYGMSLAIAEVAAALAGKSAAPTLPSGNRAPLDDTWMRAEIERRKKLAALVPVARAPFTAVSWQEARLPLVPLQKFVQRWRRDLPDLTLNDVIVAALHATIGANANVVVVKATVDLRGDVPSPLLVANQTAQAFIVSDRAARSEPLALFRCIVEQMAAVKTHKRELPAVDLAAAAEARAIGTTAVFSNIGDHAEGLLGPAGFAVADGGVMPTATALHGSFFAYVWGDTLGLSRTACTAVDRPTAAEVVARLAAWSCDG